MYLTTFYLFRARTESGDDLMPIFSKDEVDAAEKIMRDTPVTNGNVDFLLEQLAITRASRREFVSIKEKNLTGSQVTNEMILGRYPLLQRSTRAVSIKNLP